MSEPVRAVGMGAELRDNRDARPVVLARTA